jgi:hypothetical protein
VDGVVLVVVDVLARRLRGLRVGFRVVMVVAGLGGVVVISLVGEIWDLSVSLVLKAMGVGLLEWGVVGCMEVASGVGSRLGSAAMGTYRETLAPGVSAWISRLCPSACHVPLSPSPYDNSVFLAVCCPEPYSLVDQGQYCPGCAESPWCQFADEEILLKSGSGGASG